MKPISLTLSVFLLGMCVLARLDGAVAFKLLNGLFDDESNEELKSAELLDEENMFENKKEVKYVDTLFPSNKLASIGQVGGVATLQDGSLAVFHRGDRHWTFDSFIGSKFNTNSYGPIEQNVFEVFDLNKMEKKISLGKNLFYMPHGLSIDHEGKVWLTDVGLHQVFKYDLNNFDKPELVLGEKFEPGNDEKHFCKPTDVAVSSKTGHVFVSDGYCNSRVVEFDKQGKFVKQFADPSDPLQVSHSVTLIEKFNLVCAASRQNGRIVCFDIDTGKLVAEITDSKFMRTVFAIEYDPLNELLHAATGDNGSKEGLGLSFDVSENNFGELVQIWDASNRDLKRAHDIAVSRDGSRIFIGQLNGEIDVFAYE